MTFELRESCLLEGDEVAESLAALEHVASEASTQGSCRLINQGKIERLRALASLSLLEWSLTRAFFWARLQKLPNIDYQ